MTQPAWPGTAAAPQDVDPLEGGDKAPAISFKGAPVGTTISVKITAPGKLVQSRNFDTGELDFWPGNAPGQQGNPKMAAVYNGEVDGEPRSVWATKPSALFAALVEAQKKAGQKIGPGGTLHVRFTGEVPNTKNPRLNPIKQYAALYEPPAPSDPLAPPNFVQAGSQNASGAAAPQGDPDPFSGGHTGAGDPPF